MANVKQGQTVPACEWAKHLRDGKRRFWHRQRQDNKRLAEDAPVHTHNGNKKNTKKWCRGVEGREHKFETRNWFEMRSWNSKAVWLIDVCSVCGRHDYFRKK